MPAAHDLTDLERRLGLPMKVRLTPEVWTAAMILGRLRTLVNDVYRSADRDRGTTKNSLDDRQGALGELVGVWLAHGAAVGEPARGLLDLRRSVDLPDLTTRGRSPLRLDVKCHLDDGRKHLFVVNQRAYLRSRRRGVHGFLPLVSQDLGGRAVVGRNVPIDALQRWPVRSRHIETRPTP